MTNPSVVLTGAHSYLGRRVIRGLLQGGHCDVHAVVTPWADVHLEDTGPGRLHIHQADLTRPLSPRIEDVLGSADRVFHFAWVRGRDLRDVSRINEDIIRALIEGMPIPSRFYLISSAAAAPRAMSVYGQAKWSAERLTRKLGGSVLVCGLVVEDEPQGPYQTMCRLVRGLPLAIRLGARGPRVYPVHIEDVVACIRHLTEVDPPPGHFRVFSEGVCFNQFISLLEKKYQRRRVQVTVGTRLLLGLATALKRARVAPFGLCDKVHSFFYKDDEVLRGYDTLEGIPFRPLAPL